MNKEISLEEIFPLIEEQLSSGGSASFAIHGTSMLPFLRDRKDSVRIEKPSASPRKYDIILYRRSNGDFILHRIVGIRNGDLICRGDNQVDDEFPIECNSVIGVVTQYKRSENWKSIDCFLQRVYAVLWVNTMIIRKIKRKIFSIFNKK